jgi:cellobiose phosphorylase
LRLDIDKLHFAPCLPADWTAFELRYRYGATVYRIAIAQTRAETQGMTVTVDGLEREDRVIPLVDDRHEHSVEVRMHVVVR